MAARKSAVVADGWKVSDIEYELVDSDKYVHAASRKVAEDIVAEWARPGGRRLVVLKAPMQSGKTSVLRHICYLLNVKEMHGKLAIPSDHVFVLNHLVDTQLKQQTIDRMKGVMEFPAMNVFHSRDTLLKPPYKKMLRANRVLLCDESHFGANEGGCIEKLLQEFNSPIKLDSALMDKCNVYTLLVSATPFAETADNVVHKMVFTLPVSANYYGVYEMIKAKNIIDHNKVKGLALDATATVIEIDLVTKLIALKSGFVFVRENVKSKKSMEWLARFKSVLDKYSDQIIYFSFNGETAGRTIADKRKANTAGIVREYYNAGCSLGAFKKMIKTASCRVPPAAGIDAILCSPPEKLVIIFVKEMLLAGKTLDTNFVRLVIDLPYAVEDGGNADRLAQGLMGRCCGYFRSDHNVKVITNLKRATEYVQWYRDGTAPSKPSAKTKNVDGKIVAKNVSAYENTKLKGNESIDDDEEFDDAEETDARQYTDELVEAVKNVTVQKNPNMKKLHKDRLPKFLPAKKPLFGNPFGNPKEKKKPVPTFASTTTEPLAPVVADADVESPVDAPAPLTDPNEYADCDEDSGHDSDFYRSEDEDFAAPPATLTDPNEHADCDEDSGHDSDFYRSDDEDFYDRFVVDWSTREWHLKPLAEPSEHTHELAQAMIDEVINGEN